MTSYQIFDQFELVYDIVKNRSERARLASLTGYYLRVDAPCLESSGFFETPEDAGNKLAQATKKAFPLPSLTEMNLKGEKGGGSCLT